MMGAEASVTEIGWENVPPRFARFLAAIEPSSAERLAVEAAGREVAALLDRRFGAAPGKRLRPRAESGRPSETVRVIGGYAKGTAISGRATIDLLQVTTDRGDGSAAKRTDAIIDLLGERYGAVRVAPPGWLMVEPGHRSAGDGPVRVRVLTAHASASGGLRAEVPSTRRQGPVWMHLDPAAEAAHLNLIDRLADGKARHLIRIVKAWRRAMAVPLSGFAIELLVAEFLSLWLYRRRSLLFYDWMVRDFFFWLTLQAGHGVTAPGTGEPLPLQDAWREAAASAHAAAARAADLERDNQSRAALAHWRRIFGLAITDAPRTAEAGRIA